MSFTQKTIWIIKLSAFLQGLEAVPLAFLNMELKSLQHMMSAKKLLIHTTTTLSSQLEVKHKLCKSQHHCA